MKIWKRLVLFYLGGMAYAALELLWRGRTHGSMFVLGGGCFLALGRLRPAPMLVRALGGSALITVGELLTGLIVNRSYRVWDYRAMPGNFRGQICPRFSLLWIPVGLAAMALYGALDGAICTFLGKNRDNS